jgi:hypothetical protein
LESKNKDGETEEGLIRSVPRDILAWLLMVFGLGFLMREAYLRYTGERSSLEPLYWYLFVEHRAISMPIIVLTLVTALLVDHIRAKRNPQPTLGLLSKVVALCAIALAGYISINGI